MHGIVSTHEGVTHDEEVSSVLSESNSAESFLYSPSIEFDNVILRIHFEPDIGVLVLELSREKEFNFLEFLSLIAVESEGTVLDEVLFDLEMVNNLFGEGLPVVSGDHGERSSSVEDRVDRLVGSRTAREVGSGVSSESKVRHLGFAELIILTFYGLFSKLNRLHFR